MTRRWRRSAEFEGTAGAVAAVALAVFGAAVTGADLGRPPFTVSLVVLAAVSGFLAGLAHSRLSLASPALSLPLTLWLGPVRGPAGADGVLVWALASTGVVLAVGASEYGLTAFRTTARHGTARVARTVAASLVPGGTLAALWLARPRPPRYPSPALDPWLEAVVRLHGVVGILTLVAVPLVLARSRRLVSPALPALAGALGLALGPLVGWTVPPGTPDPLALLWPVVVLVALTFGWIEWRLRRLLSY